MRSRRRAAVRRRRAIGVAYLLRAPPVRPVLLFGGALASPLAWEIWASFTSLSPQQDGTATFVGLDNYRHHLADRQFWVAAAVPVAHGAGTNLAQLGPGPRAA